MPKLSNAYQFGAGPVSDIKPIQDLLRKAGSLIMRYYQAQDFSIDIKKDDSPVTSADQASNELILSGLSEFTPNIPIISEETAKTPYEIRKTWNYCWMVDPLDGTKEFIKGNGEFSINLALIHQHLPVIGFVYFPVQQWLYGATKNKGAYKIEDLRPETQDLRPETQDLRPHNPGFAGPLKIMISRSHSGQRELDFIDHIKNLGYEVETRPHGSAMKHCLLAEGKGDIYPKFGICHEWDTAPGQLILEEAGGSLTRTTDWKPLEYNKPEFTNPEFIMWGPRVPTVLRNTLSGS